METLFVREPRCASCAASSLCFARDRRLSFLFVLRASGEQLQQHDIAFALKFFDRAGTGFFRNSFEKSCLTSALNSVIFPRSSTMLKRARELRQEMLHPTLTAPRWNRRLGRHNSHRSPGPQHTAVSESATSSTPWMRYTTSR